ncbi:MAG TPA: hypothetical protein VFS92_09165 [Planctomycetota bacterium]|nr:hypothetical protein [Planctomycetota bacterium]
MADAGVRIHPAWWSPRLFPYVLVMGAMLVIPATLMPPRVIGHPAMLVLLVPFGVIALLFSLQRRLCAILLLPDAIVFPKWRLGDTSEVGVAIYLDAATAASDNADRVTTLAADEILDWIPESGRIVLRTRFRGKDAIALRGISERDRERIVAWLKEKVGD